MLGPWFPKNLTMVKKIHQRPKWRFQLNLHFAKRMREQEMRSERLKKAKFFLCLITKKLGLLNLETG